MEEEKGSGFDGGGKADWDGEQGGKRYIRLEGQPKREKKREEEEEEEEVKFGTLIRSLHDSVNTVSLCILFQ